jgi:hydroxyisourate hydrolase
VSVDRLNALPPAEAEAAFLACCGSRAWARWMISRRPYRDTADLLETADRVWASLAPADWREAFAAHPRIGETKQDGEERFRRWSAAEQSGAAGADAAVRAELAEANRLYEQRFGHLFIVCASGKSAEEMLGLLRQRLGNDPGTAGTELTIAAEEQRKITRLRLEKLAAEGEGEPAMHGITTHVLDTARGKPAAGVPVILETLEIRGGGEEGSGGSWRELARAVTDGDGRVRPLLPAGTALVPGTYRITFAIETYFRDQEIEAFYPEAAIVFDVRDAGQHYHVPLLLSPYGYSTYRGS